MNLRNAKIVGYFSLPPKSLQNENPSAYQLLMAQYPNECGTCAHCGTGIRHHVVLDVDGSRVNIGTTCAEKVGIDPVMIRNRWVAADMDIMNVLMSKMAQHEINIRNAHIQRMQHVGFIVDFLKSMQSSFASSLAEQLTRAALSPKQAACVAKLMSSTGKRNKQNAEWFDDIVATCTTEEFPE